MQKYFQVCPEVNFLEAWNIPLSGNVTRTVRRKMLVQSYIIFSRTF